MRIALQAAFKFSRRLTNLVLQHVLNHGSPTRPMTTFVNYVYIIKLHYNTGGCGHRYCNFDTCGPRTSPQ